MNKLMSYIVSDALSEAQKEFANKVRSKNAKRVLKVQTSRGVMVFTLAEEYKAVLVSRITGNPILEAFV